MYKRTLLMLLCCALPLLKAVAQRVSEEQTKECLGSFLPDGDLPSDFKNNAPQLDAFSVLSNHSLYAEVLNSPARRPLVALKTDLLLCGGILPDFKMGTWTPNLSIEFYFARHWSVQAGGAYANWDALEGSKELFALSVVDVEARYWFGKTSAYRGLFIGMYGQYGEYDAQQGMRATSLGNTGHFWGTGAGLGWMLPFGSGWAVEGEARGGWRSASNSVYQAEDGTYYYENCDKKSAFNVQLRLSMVYRFGTNKSR